MARVYLALGSNIDDRIAYLSKTEKILRDHEDIEILRTSNIYETEPWPKEDHEEDHPHGEKGQKWFLNQILEVETGLTPIQLLKASQEIEKKLGRTEKHHWGAREIDIDILLYDDEVLDLPELTLPHRHMRDRQFVLVPLVEIAPRLKDPVSGKAFADFLEEAKETDDHKVTPFL